MMVQEKRVCTNPEEVRQTFKRKVPLPSRAMMVENQRQYQRIQQAVSAFYASEGESKLASEPPCATCPVDVFHYCEATGTECRRFVSYTNE